MVKPGVLAAGCAAALATVVAVAGLGGCTPPAGAPTPSASSTSRAPATPEPLPVTRRVVPVSAREEYLGSEACAGCHPKEAVANASRHARTLVPVTESEHAARFRDPVRYTDRALGASYEVSVRAGRCVFRARGQGKTVETTADYAFGAGNVATTYVHAGADGARQLRLSWYPQHGWDWTPGLPPGSPETGIVGQELDKNRANDCFSCHSTVVVEGSTGPDLQHTLVGIGCETCHGPGKAHVETVGARGKSLDIQMVRLAARRPEVNAEICGACHRKPFSIDAADPNVGRLLPRFQGAALSLSKCSVVGGATCMHCHDPHRDADELSLVEYNRTCKSCHSRGKGTEGTQGTQGAQGTRGVECPKAPRGDCVSCHMPAQTTGAFPTGRTFRNHWIKVWPEASPPAHRR